MTRFCVGDWLVEPTLNSLSRPDRTVRLEPKVMQVLVCLAEHPGTVVSKNRLFQSVWPGTYVTDDVLTRAVSELRHVFGDDPKHSRFIETIPKGGYRLVARVAPTSAPAVETAEATSFTSEAVAALLTRQPSTSSRRLAPDSSRGRFAAARQPALVAAALAVLLAGAAWGSWSWMSPGSAAVTNSQPLTRSGHVMFPDRRLMHFPGLATDGTRVYFSQGPSWGESLAQVPVAGGPTGAVRTPFSRQIVHDISADGSRLLVQEQTTALGLDTREGPLWAVPLAGHGPLRLGDVLAHDAAWSSSGRQLVFANGQDLYVAAWDGSHPRKLATTPGRAYWIRWAPDDTALRFTLTEGSFRTSLWEVRMDGTGLRRLLSDWRSDAQPCCGEWSPDGRHFVFVAFENKRSDIWIRRESNSLWRTASDPGRLTSGPLSFASVIFTGDGRRLLAVSPQVRGTVNRFNLVSRAIEPSRIEGVCLRFSPDRQWVLYLEPVSRTLWRSRPDGSDALQLTAPPLQSGCASWSPDGKRVAFCARTPGGPYKLYVVFSSGGAVRQLIGGTRHEVDANWSPDGNSIMFGRPPDVLAEHGMPKAIHVLNLKTGKITTLPGSEGMFSPRWTSDGRFVIALPHENWDRLMRLNIATETWAELVPYHAAGPQVSPDGEWVYYESEHDGSHLARVRLRDGHNERLFDFADVTRGTLLTCGMAGGVDLDGSPFLDCIVNASELYALDLDLP